MERSLQVIRPARRAWLSAAAALFAALLLAGCGSEVKESPYQLSERSFLGGEGQGIHFFAEDLCVPDGSGAYEDEAVTAESAALFSLSDGTVPYYKNMYERMNPASITKVMTALVAIRYGNLSDLVTVTEDAVITEAGATLAGIEPGDVLTLEQLLYGLMLPSGNDAGAAIAVHIAGSVEAFADMMNEEAARIGAVDTHFVNPHGLHDPDHYTTAYDLYLIFHEAMKDATFRKVAGSTAYTASYRDKSGQTVTKTWKGGNWFMTGERETPEGITVIGGKTWTSGDELFKLIAVLCF